MITAFSQLLEKLSTPLEVGWVGALKDVEMGFDLVGCTLGTLRGCGGVVEMMSVVGW